MIDYFKLLQLTTLGSLVLLFSYGFLDLIFVHAKTLSGVVH